MFNDTKLKQSQKIIIGLMIALLFIGLILTLTYKYFESMAQSSRILNTNPIGQEAIIIEEADPIDLDKLAGDYLIERNKIVNDFLFVADSDSGELSSLARDTQSQLLNLVLPPQYRETHLTLVLLLSEISELADTNNITALNNKVEVLRGLISE
jgi:hypothetical protein